MGGNIEFRLEPITKENTMSKRDVIDEVYIDNQNDEILLIKKIEECIELVGKRERVVVTIASEPIQKFEKAR